MAQNHVTGENTWLPISAAADLAQVSRRTAFRWIERGFIPWRLFGSRRVVAVEALVGFAARKHGADLAQEQAISAERADAPPPPGRGEVEDALEQLSEATATQQDLLNGLWNRVEKIERHLGLR